MKNNPGVSWRQLLGRLMQRVAAAEKLNREKHVYIK